MTGHIQGKEHQNNESYGYEGYPYLWGKKISKKNWNLILDLDWLERTLEIEIEREIRFSFN